MTRNHARPNKGNGVTNGKNYGKSKGIGSYSEITFSLLINFFVCEKLVIGTGSKPS